MWEIAPRKSDSDVCCSHLPRNCEITTHQFGRSVMAGGRSLPLPFIFDATESLMLPRAVNRHPACLEPLLIPHRTKKSRLTMGLYFALPTFDSLMASPVFAGIARRGTARRVAAVLFKRLLNNTDTVLIFRRTRASSQLAVGGAFSSRRQLIFQHPRS